MSKLDRYIEEYKSGNFRHFFVNPLYRIKITHILGTIILVINAVFFTENIIAVYLQLLVAFVITIHDFDDKFLKNSLSQKIDELNINRQELKQEAQKVHELNSTLKERIKAEVAKNRDQEKTIMHQSKLAQMGEMISMIAHQWRQPLSAISANSNDLTMKIMLDNYEKDYFSDKLEKIANFSQHLSKTIDDFRGFYKEDKEKIDITYKDIVDTSLDIVTISIETKNINITRDCNSIHKINTYKNELRQVVLNLIKNAEDILLEKEIKDPVIKIKTYDKDKYSYLAISDNAGGVPDDIKDKIFEPYFTTKDKLDGTGLGLYMSKTIIEEHCNGELSVSNDEEGAVFMVKMENLN